MITFICIGDISKLDYKLKSRIEDYIQNLLSEVDKSEGIVCYKVKKNKVFFKTKLEIERSKFKNGKWKTFCYSEFKGEFYTHWVY